MATTRDTPQVWVGCLACYNDGRLIGEWVDAIDAGNAPETLSAFERCRAMLHEEFMCFDHQDFGGIVNHEIGVVEAQEIAEKIDEIPEYYPLEAVAAFLSNQGESMKDFDLSDFEESYQGEHASEEEYAETLAEELDMVPNEYKWPTSYIDWERAARDLFMDGYWSSQSDGGVFVFRDI